jgi:hypothetical protein
VSAPKHYATWSFRGAKLIFRAATLASFTLKPFYLVDKSSNFPFDRRMSRFLAQSTDVVTCFLPETNDGHPAPTQRLVLTEPSRLDKPECRT